MKCINSQCKCQENFSDCDGDESNGCETFQNTCECIPGQTTSCYPYDNKYVGIGICQAGTSTCHSDGYWNICEGYVLPSKSEIANNGLDDNCNGQVDEQNVDLDGDGWTAEQGDCCDDPEVCNANAPESINPDAYDIPGNSIDDNCDGIIDNTPATTCSTQTHRPAANTSLDTNDAMKLAQAMDICTTATQTSGFGLIQAQLLHADGSPLETTGNATICGTRTLISPSQQIAVLNQLGQNNSISAISGQTMAVLSSGRAMGNENTELDECMGSQVSVPERFLSKHNGFLPVSSVCETTSNGTMANDSIMLKLLMRAPSNAMGFRFKFKFFSKEYPNFVCQNYNDFFLAMVDASSNQIPEDHNVSFDINHNPVSVNNAFFTECTPGSCNAEKGCSTCPDGDQNVQAYLTKDGSNMVMAGATGWLTTSVPVSANEVFTLDLIIFDASEKITSQTPNGYGHLKDSLVLLDSFEWMTTPTALQTVPDN